MDVGDDCRIETVFAQASHDILQVFAFARPLRGQPHDFAACTVDAFDLRDTGFGVVGVGIGHRLHGNGPFAADDDVADAYFAGLAPLKVMKLHWDVLPFVLKITPKTRYKQK